MKISADGSSYGLGAVLLQRENQSWQPVIYASRAKTKTECGYAQVEKRPLLQPGHAKSLLVMFWARSLL